MVNTTFEKIKYFAKLFSDINSTDQDIRKNIELPNYNVF